MAKHGRQNQEFRFSPGMGFGMAAAEQDSLLSECFFPTSFYQIVRNIKDPRSGLIGRSGSGKTAILERLQSDKFRTVSVKPEELAFRYLGNSDLIQALRDSGVNLDFFYKLLWRHVFVVEILKHRFPEDARQTGLVWQLIERIQRSVKPDQARERAIKYLDDWGATVLQEPQERVQEIHQTFERRLKSTLGVDGPWRTVFGLAAGLEGEVVEKTVIEERVRTAQNLVSQIQVQDLNAVRDYIGTDIIDDPQNPCFVLIDDLDRFWVEEPVLYELIRAMLLEIYDWSRVPNVKIVYALRDNVLHRLERDFQSPAYQREKLADQQIRLRWTRYELIELANMRLAWLAGKSGDSNAPRLDGLLPKKRNDRPSGIDYLLDRTLNRPRDVIDFLNHASQLAVGKKGFPWGILHEAEQPYSYGRLAALFDEWSQNYAGLDLLARKMLQDRKARFPISDWDEEVLLDLFTDHRVNERLWLQRQYDAFNTMYQADAVKAVRYFTSLFTSVMFEVGLIGIKNLPGNANLYSSSHRPILPPEQVTNEAEVIIHPMFYSALRTVLR